jgi:hypothetical protein
VTSDYPRPEVARTHPLSLTPSTTGPMTTFFPPESPSSDSKSSVYSLYGGLRTEMCTRIPVIVRAVLPLQGMYLWHWIWSLGDFLELLL